MRQEMSKQFREGIAGLSMHAGARDGKAHLLLHWVGQKQPRGILLSLTEAYARAVSVCALASKQGTSLDLLLATYVTRRSVGRGTSYAHLWSMHSVRIKRLHGVDWGACSMCRCNDQYRYSAAAAWVGTAALPDWMRMCTARRATRPLM